jgi:transketolase
LASQEGGEARGHEAARGGYILSEPDSGAPDIVLIATGSEVPLAIEAGRTDGWWKYVGLDGGVIGIDRFGESAPADALYRFFDLTPERIAKAAHALL